MYIEASNRKAWKLVAGVHGQERKDIRNSERHEDMDEGFPGTRDGCWQNHKDRIA